MIPAKPTGSPFPPEPKDSDGVTVRRFAKQPRTLFSNEELKDRSMSRLTENTAAPSLFQRLAQAFTTWKTHRREMAELAAMGDRDLADIGVTRGDFLAIRKGTFENSRAIRQALRATAPAQPTVNTSNHDTRVAA